jgi:hypothetical protein
MSKEARGSEKLWDRIFEHDQPTHARLGEAVAAARENYKILRWWKYGQPAIDRVRTTLDVATADSGLLIQDILHSAGANKAAIILEAFPYGVPQLERVQVDVTFQRNVG